MIPHPASTHLFGETKGRICSNQCPLHALEDIIDGVDEGALSSAHWAVQQDTQVLEVGFRQTELSQFVLHPVSAHGARE